MKLGDCLGSIMMIMVGSHTYSNDIRKALIKNERDSGECIKLSNNLLFRDLYPFTHFFFFSWKIDSSSKVFCFQKEKVTVCVFCMLVLQLGDGLSLVPGVAILLANSRGSCEGNDRADRTACPIGMHCNYFQSQLT